VDLHPEEGCEGPLDLYLSLEVDPRVLLGFEDAVIARDALDDPPDDFYLPLTFTWALPPLPKAPDLLVLATELAASGGPDLPLEVSAIDSYPSVTDAPETSLRVVAHQRVSLLRIRDGEEVSPARPSIGLVVSRHLPERAGDWSVAASGVGCQLARSAPRWPAPPGSPGPGPVLRTRGGTSRWSSTIRSSSIAIPTDAAMVASPELKRYVRARLSRMRPAICSASSRLVMFSQITTNSSPPNRATASPARTLRSSRRATRSNSSSPAT
jgi:hypothetical protein